jgi:acyl-[acyl carrier protein]--UDP-N-acetylglucosamine O-acyltransferase
VKNLWAGGARGQMLRFAQHDTKSAIYSRAKYRSIVMALSQSVESRQESEIGNQHHMLLSVKIVFMNL